VTDRPWLGAVSDASKAVQSLQWRDPAGPWGLASSDREGKAWRFATFTAAHADDARVWIESQERDERNVYASLNRVRADLTSKAKKADVVACVALLVDVDVPALPDGWADTPQAWALGAQDRLFATLDEQWPADLPLPTVRLFSGGGVQLIWECATPYADDDRIELFERMAQVAQERVGAMGLVPDHTFNVDRLVRLRGTTNRPKATKQAKGQTDTVAAIVSTHRKYALEDLRAAFDRPLSKQTVAPEAVGAIEPLTVTDEDLAAWGVNEALAWIIRTGVSGYGAAKLKDNSRSAWEWDAVCRMIRLGLDDAQIAGVLLNTAWKIGERARERRNPIDHIARLVKRARHVTNHAERQFACGDDGRPVRCRPNYITAAHKLGLKLSYNEFADVLSIGGIDGVGPALDDKAVTRVRFAIEDRFSFLPDRELLADVLADEAVQNRFNPVRDHLDTLKWDGVARLDNWLSAYCKAEDSAYTREVGRVFLIAAVRRAKRPGCKFDTMLILEGTQGAYKSTAVRVLAGRDEWFSDVVPIGEEGNRVIEATRGKWIIEEGELAGMNDRTVERLKAFCSRVADRGRLAYERRPVDIPRAFVIVGTTNSKSYLNDMTGARRFLPVKVGRIDIEALIRDRDQLLAEAVEREATGEAIILSDAVGEAAELKRRARTLTDDWIETLRTVTDGDEVWSGQCWAALRFDAGARDKSKQKRLADCLEAMGFERSEAQPPRGSHLGTKWTRARVSVS